MATRLKLPDPARAAEYFENKMTFTTGPAEVQHLFEKGEPINVIDVRLPEDFAEGHIPGAVSVPKEQWDSFEGLSKDKVNIVYCYTAVCHLAAAAARRFARKGFPVMELEGGFAEWKNYGYEIERGAPGREEKKSA
jgi:rhodanese-related sulfurtransferase